MIPPMKSLTYHTRIMLLGLIFAALCAPKSAAYNYTTSESPLDIKITELSIVKEVLQEDSITKEQKKALKKEERARRKAEIIAQRQQMKAIDNPNHADYILLGENLPRGKTVLEAMSGRVPGMSISGNSVMIHGPSSFYGGMTPMFLVDDMEVNLDFANNVSIEDIERIEVFTGSSAAIYGSRVGNGVISIFTKFYYNNKIQ